MTAIHAPTPDTRYRWVVLILCWAAFTMTSVDRATWGPAAGSVGEDLGVAVAGLGLFATTYYIGYVVSNVIGGFVADWVGARLTVGVSILLSGGFMLAFGETDTHTMGLTFQACIGLCAGAEVGGGVKLITSWFTPQRRGFAMGVFLTATSLGLVVANAVVPRLIQSHSWRTSYHLFGFTSIAIGAVCLILLRPGPLVVRQEGTGRPDLRPLLHNRSLLLLALAGFGALWGTYGFITWSNLLMVKGAGIDPVRAGTVVVIFGAVAVFSKPLIGLIGDALGLSRRRLTIGILVAFATCLIAFSFATTATQFLWIAPFLGIAAYVYSPVMMAMIPTLSGGQLAGSATGGVNAFWQLGSTIVPAVIGLVFGATGSFQAVFLVLAAGPCLAIIPMLLIRQADIHEQLPDAIAGHHDNDHPLTTATNGKGYPHMTSTTEPASTHYDVIVAGGGSAGVAAAVAARRTGARTLLIERGPCLGGAATLRNVVTYCGLYTRDELEQVVFGIADEVISELKARGAVSEPRKFNAVTVVFDPESVKVVLDELCHDAGVDVRLHSLLIGAHTDGDHITAVEVADHEGVHRFTADAFVDATGDADLAHHAAAQIRYGTDGWVQNGSLGVRFGGIDPHTDVTMRIVSDAVRAAKAAGIDNLIAESGLVARMPVSGDVIAYLVDEGYDARSAADTSRAETHARLQAQSYLKAIRTIPGAEHAYIVATGPELGTRESRHIITRHHLREDDILNPDTTENAVAIGAWPMEYHPGPGNPSTWKFIGDPGFYPIPLDCLRSINRSNLYAAGRTLDGDRQAGASLRVMGTAFATGHAAGIAAAQQALTGNTTTTTVREELQRQGARLPEPVPA